MGITRHDLDSLHQEERARLEGIRQLLGLAMRSTWRAKGSPMPSDSQHRIEAGMHQVLLVIDIYREVLFEQAHSVRVKRIASDFAALADLLTIFRGQELSPEDEGRVRNRIKAWHRESRQWVSLLPMQQEVLRMATSGGADEEKRAERIKACWLEAGGQFFAPPPLRPLTLPDEVPSHFSPGAILDLPQALALDLLDGTRNDGTPTWWPRPGPLLELLGFAEGMLLLAAGGADCGGRTTFADRRRRASIRDAFALSCVVLFERVVGPKTAHQSPSWRRGDRPTLMEGFVRLVQEAAVGGPIPRMWALGPDPLRKAIKIQRAWHRLFQSAGVPDGRTFGLLPEEVRQAAVKRLKPGIQARLRHVVNAWV